MATKRVGPVSQPRRVTVRSGRRSIDALLLVPEVEPASAPVVAFGHGFFQVPWGYLAFLAGLRDRGFVVIAPQSHSGPLPHHAAFADDLWACTEHAMELAPEAMPGRSALVGHSMGGGAALLAASRHPGLSAVATLAAMDTRPSVRAACARLEVPSLFVVGSDDRIVPPWRTRPLYDAAASSPGGSRWVEIDGGWHFGFVERGRANDLGGDSGRMAREEQLTHAAFTVATWLDQLLTD